MNACQDHTHISGPNPYKTSKFTCSNTRSIGSKATNSWHVTFKHCWKTERMSNVFYRMQKPPNTTMGNVLVKSCSSKICKNKRTTKISKQMWCKDGPLNMQCIFPYLTKEAKMYGHLQVVSYTTVSYLSCSAFQCCVVGSFCRIGQTRLSM